MATKSKDIIEFQISTEYNNHWMMRDALRELVSNGIDGQTMRREAKFTLDFDNNTLVLRNVLTKLDRKSLVLGVSGARADSRAIGQFGEGLLIACLVMTRDEVKFDIINDDEQWSFFIEMGSLGVPVLKAEIKPTAKTGAFTVRVYDVTDALFDALQGMFLRLQPMSTRNDVIKCGASTIYLNEEQRGRVYSKGVLVQTLSDLACGYELPDLRMNRDRASADINDIDQKVGDTMTRVDATDIKRLFDVLEGRSTRETSLLAQMSWKYYTMTQFLSVLDDDHAYVRNGSEAEVVSNYGLIPVLVSAWKYELCPSDMKIEKRRLRHEINQRRFVTLAELTPEELSVYTKVRREIETLELDVPCTIMEMEPTLLGTYSASQGVTLNRSLLANATELMITWTHELAHIMSLREDSKHRDTQALLLTKMLLARMDADVQKKA